MTDKTGLRKRQRIFIIVNIYIRKFVYVYTCGKLKNESLVFKNVMLCPPILYYFKSQIEKGRKEESLTSDFQVT